MNCSKVLELFSDYLDGEPRDDVRAAVDSHLSGCESCRRELASLRKTIALLETLPQIKAPEALASHVHAHTIQKRAHTMTRPAVRTRRWSIGLAAGLAAAVLLALLFYVLQNRGPAGGGGLTGTGRDSPMNVATTDNPHGKPDNGTGNSQGKVTIGGEKNAPGSNTNLAGGGPAGSEKHSPVIPSDQGQPQELAIIQERQPEVHIPEIPGMTVRVEAQQGKSVGDSAVGDIYIGPRNEYEASKLREIAPGSGLVTTKAKTVKIPAGGGSLQSLSGGPAKEEEATSNDSSSSLAAAAPGVKRTVVMRAKDVSEAIPQIKKVLAKAVANYTCSTDAKGNWFVASLPSNEAEALLKQLRGLSEVLVESEETNLPASPPQAPVTLIIQLLPAP